MMNMQVFLLLDKEDKRKWDGNSSSENKDRLTEITIFLKEVRLQNVVSVKNASSDAPAKHKS